MISQRPTASVSGGRGIWQRKAKGRKRLKALNPFGRGNAPARPLHAMLGATRNCKISHSPKFSNSKVYCHFSLPGSAKFGDVLLAHCHPDKRILLGYVS